LKDAIKTITEYKALSFSLNADIAIFGLALLLFSPQGNAGPPVAFGSGGCPAGFSCEVNVSSQGMEQRVLTDNNGTQYIQVTVQDGAVNNGGRLDYESFVNGSNGNVQGGVSAKLDINQTGQFNMDYSTILNLGWANTNGSAIEIDHTNRDSGNGIDFEQNFNYLQNQDNQGRATGYYYGIREKVVGSGYNSGGGTQTFVLRRAGGDFVRSGSASLSGANDMGMMDGGGGGGGMTGGTTTGDTTGGTTTGDTTTSGGGGGGGGMRRKASIGGRALTGTNSYQNATTAIYDSFGNDGTDSGVNASGATGREGDPQTLPAANTVYGPDANSSVFAGMTPDNNDTISSTDNQNMASINTDTINIGNSNGEINSNGNASGPAAPTTAINVPTGDAGGMGGGGGLPGGTVSWNTGQEVQVIWIGQSCAGCVVSGGMMGGMQGGGSGVFSFQQYDNISSGASAASRSINSTAPLNWMSNPFGAQPGL